MQKKSYLNGCVNLEIKHSLTQKMEHKTNNKTITLLCSKSDFAICRSSKAVANRNLECQFLFSSITGSQILLALI